MASVDLIPPDEISYATRVDVSPDYDSLGGVEIRNDVNNNANKFKGGRQPSKTKESDYARINKITQENVDGQPLSVRLEVISLRVR